MAKPRVGFGSGFGGPGGGPGGGSGGPDGVGKRITGERIIELPFEYSRPM